MPKRESERNYCLSFEQVLGEEKEHVGLSPIAGSRLPSKKNGGTELFKHTISPTSAFSLAMTFRLSLFPHPL